MVKPTHYDGRSYIKSAEHFTFSKMSTYFKYLPFEVSLLAFSVLFLSKSWLVGGIITWLLWKLIGWWCHNMITLKIKVCTEIQEWYVEWLILKICRHLWKSRILSWFNMSSTIMVCGLNIFVVWPDSSSLDITLINVYKVKIVFSSQAREGRKLAT